MAVPAGRRRPVPAGRHGPRVLADGGVAALVYDHRNLGASDGKPRGDIDPWQQIDDYRSAIAFAAGLDGVDADVRGRNSRPFMGRPATDRAFAPTR